jgi:hypothetical protein
MHRERNKMIAKTVNKGFDRKTNLAKVLGKTIGRAKLAGDALVFAGGYFYSCQAVGK